MIGSTFDSEHVLQHLKHFLPSQTPIKDFIHHNTLHAYQHMKFYDGIFKAEKVFGYQVTLELKDFRKLHSIGRISDEILERLIVEKKGKEQLKQWKDNVLSKEYDTHTTPRIHMLRSEWKNSFGIDLDNMVQPLFFRILCSYLDQGISIWKFPINAEGFLSSVRDLERNNLVSFFKSKRARTLFLEGNITINALLEMIVGDKAYFEQYLYDQQFSHPGWSGMVAAVEDAPNTLLDDKKISLAEMITFELLLELDALDNQLGSSFKPLTHTIDSAPLDLFGDVQLTELHDVRMLLQTAFEWSYYDQVISGITKQNKKPAEVKDKTFQAIFCIDERECSIRRHIESTDPNCETLSTPGFFGVEFYFQPQGAQFYDKLCPAPVTPKYLIKESEVTEKRKHELLYTPNAHTFFGGTLSSLTLGFAAGARLIENVFRPRMSPAISDAFAHMNKSSRLSVENKDPQHIENNLQVGFTVSEMVTRAESVLRSIGLLNNFAPLIYLIGHGSSSANNPHHSAHDCGACSGRPGSVNARVMCHMLNHAKVREILKDRGINIPSSTQFVPSLHDTAADQIAFYDEDVLTAVNRAKHIQNIEAFENALDLNAKERSRRFASINTKNDLKKVRQDILKRSVSMFEPRPELGHGTNTLCIIGDRKLTKGLFLDRRAFLNSYDHTTDPEGKILTGIMRPIGPVCGGISLEYYFSRVDNYKLGAGTKLPHNVMGLIGVANSSDGDLRPGLPLQMIEVHDPVRLLVIVEHYPDVVLKTIQTAPEMYEWYVNEWVHIAAIHPETKQCYYFEDGAFKLYEPLTKKVSGVKEVISLIESAKEMDTNHITDATGENLPVYELLN